MLDRFYARYSKLNYNQQFYYSSRTWNGLLAPSPDKAREAAGQKSTYQCWFHHLSECPLWSQTERTGVSGRISGQPRNNLRKFKQESFKHEYIRATQLAETSELKQNTDFELWPPSFECSGQHPPFPQTPHLQRATAPSAGLPASSWLLPLCSQSRPRPRQGSASSKESPGGSSWLLSAKNAFGASDILENKSYVEGWHSVLQHGSFSIFFNEKNL